MYKPIEIGSTVKISKNVPTYGGVRAIVTRNLPTYPGTFFELLLDNEEIASMGIKLPEGSMEHPRHFYLKRKHFNPVKPVAAVDRTINKGPGPVLLSLTNSELKTLVDAEDYDDLRRYKWRLQKSGSGRVDVVRNTTTQERLRGMAPRVAIHRHILGVEDSKMDVDHINRDTLDNRRSNLRECTRQQNTFNTGARRNNKHGAKGVGVRSSGRWYAAITIAGKRTHLGYFDSKEKAVAAYDAKAKELHGEFFYGGVK